MTRKAKTTMIAAILTVMALLAGGAAAGVGSQDRSDEVGTQTPSGESVARPARFDPETGASDVRGGSHEPADADGAEAAEDAAEGPDVPITDPDLERASQAALSYLGEGRVTGTEVGDEESYYEVEVTLDDGRQVDVQLDESFQVVGTD